MALRVELASPLHARWQADIDRVVTVTRAALGEGAWAAAYITGRSLSQEEAIAEALEINVSSG